MIFDTNQNTTPVLDRIKSLGFTHIIRYNGTGSKSITKAEAQAIAARGFQLAIVYEGWGDTKHELEGAVGVRHARDFLRLMEVCGQPEGSGAYFAVDADESQGAVKSRIVPYFQGINDVIGRKLRIGVYGSGLTCQMILDSRLAELAWLSCSTGWAGYRDFKNSNRWNLLQHTPVRIAGLDADPDDINPDRPDIGAFIPFGNAGPVTVPHDTRWLQSRLNSLGANPHLSVDGYIGPATIREIERYLPKE